MRAKILVTLMLAASGIASMDRAWSVDKEVAERFGKYEDPEASSVAASSTNRVVLKAGDADSKATIRLSNAFNAGSERYGRYALTVTAPFDGKKADQVEVGNLSGLTSGTSASFELTSLHWPKVSGAK